MPVSTSISSPSASARAIRGIQRFIGQGQWNAGETLPSAQFLSEHLEVDRKTVLREGEMGRIAVEQITALIAAPKRPRPAVIVPFGFDPGQSIGPVAKHPLRNKRPAAIGSVSRGQRQL